MRSSLLDNLPEALAAVRTRSLFVMRLSSRVQVIGPTPGYVRRVGAVLGGAFEGERLTGEVLDSGNDWQTVRIDSAVTLDVRLVLKTDDEAMIGRPTGESGTGPPTSWRASIAARRSTRRAIIFIASALGGRRRQMKIRSFASLFTKVSDGRKRCAQVCSTICLKLSPP